MKVPSLGFSYENAGILFAAIAIMFFGLFLYFDQYADTLTPVAGVMWVIAIMYFLLDELQKRRRESED